MLCESRVNVSHGSAWVRAPGELIPLGSRKRSRVGRCYKLTVFFSSSSFHSLSSRRSLLLGIVCGCQRLQRADADRNPLALRRGGGSSVLERVVERARLFCCVVCGVVAVVSRSLACAYAVLCPIVTLWRTIHMTGPRGSAVRVGFARLKRKPHTPGGERSPDKILVGLEL